MCGIVAMIAKAKHGFPYKSKGLFQQMLYTNALRGFDSTGIFAVNNYGNAKIMKSAQPASAFLNTKTAQEFMDRLYLDYKIVVGHNRASTKGATNDTNAHPFVEGNTCLVHNGTLHSHKHLKDVDVDSHAICHAISDGDYKEVIPELNGAFALIWYDAEKKSLHISRNKERPLWLIETDDVDYIASESDMLEWLLKRNGVKYKEACYFAINEVYTYHLDELDKGYTMETLPEKKASPLVQQQLSLPGPVGGLVLNQGKIESSVNLDTVTSSNFWQIYKGNSVVNLKHEVNTSVNGQTIFRGITADKHKVKWACTITGDVDSDLINADYFEGKVRGFSCKGDKITLIIEDLKPEIMYTSINGILVGEVELYEHNNGVCHSCGHFIDPEEELFWVRHKNNEIKALKCETCCTKNHILNKLVEQVYNVL